MRPKLLLWSLLLMLMVSGVAVVSTSQSVSEDFSSVKGLPWDLIWRHVNQNLEWSLSRLNPVSAEWEDISGILSLNRTYPLGREAVLTWFFDTPSEGDYRLKVTMQKDLTWLNHLETFVWRIQYPEYVLRFEWSNLTQIRTTVTYGMERPGGEKWFWVQMIRRDIPQDTRVIIESRLIVSHLYGDESKISSLNNLIVSDGHLELDVASIPSYWWNTSWAASTTLTINSTLIEENLTDFPILVHLNRSRIDWSRVLDNLDDLRFTQDNVSTLSYEIESYTLNDEAWIWVKVPFISSVTDTTVFMYYDNPQAENGEDSANVWDVHYVLVNHMTDAPDPSQTLDSTRYANDGVKKGVGEPVEAEGRIGWAQDFGGDGSVDDYVNHGDDPELNEFSQLTLEAWVFPDTAQYAGGIVTKSWRGRGRPHPFMLYNTLTEPWNRPRLVLDNGTAVDWLEGNQLMPLGQWSYVVGTWDGDAMYLWVDNRSAPDSPVAFTGTLTTTTAECTIGRAFGTHVLYCFDGRIDEVRVSNVSRSTAWISASYESGRDRLLQFGEVVEITTKGVLNSVDFLRGVNTASILFFSYECAIPLGEQIVFQFSFDNSTWYSSSQWGRIQDGAHTIDLTSLDWSVDTFYIRAILTSKTATATLNFLSLTYTTSATEARAPPLLYLIIFLVVGAIVILAISLIKFR